MSINKLILKDLWVEANKFSYNKVRVIAVTKPLITEIQSAEEVIAYAARVSNPSNQSNSLTATKLLKYLAKHKHWSPFEMSSIVLEIQTTRDIARQILRHRSFSFQEFSQRYADPREIGFVDREARLQDLQNRQNSVSTEDKDLQGAWEAKQTDVLIKIKEAYNWAITNGIAKEQARAVLPEGMTMSRMYMNGTLRSWIHYCDLRMSNGTQAEHMDIAKKCWDEITAIYPSIREVLASE